MTKIQDEYVGWANTLDSAGTDSSAVIGRLMSDQILEVMATALAQCTELGRYADVLKKYLFYDKSPVSGSMGHRTLLASQTIISIRRSFVMHTEKGHNNVRLLHAILGLITETAELCEMFDEAIRTESNMDGQNLLEEVGDIFWYLALCARFQNFNTFDPYLMSNQSKLIARYGATWTKDAALNRNIENEMNAIGTPDNICPVCKGPAVVGFGGVCCTTDEED